MKLISTFGSAALYFVRIFKQPIFKAKPSSLCAAVGEVGYFSATTRRTKGPRGRATTRSDSRLDPHARPGGLVLRASVSFRMDQIKARCTPDDRLPIGEVAAEPVGRDGVPGSRLRC
jgi:hypothetical protein